MIGPIEDLLRRKRFDFVPSEFSVRLFAAGTYHDLYLIEGNGEPLIFRVRTSSDECAGGGLTAEHEVLRALPEGVAPRAHYIDCSMAEFPAAFRIESYISGCTLREFSPDLMVQLAECLARVHSVRYAKAGTFHGHTDRYRPGGTMTALLEERPGDPREIAALIQNTNCYIDRHSEPYRDFPGFCIIHNDLHLSNVLRSADGLKLVDWEHAERADPAQDIAILFWFDTLMKESAEPLPPPLRDCFFRRYVDLTGDGNIYERTRLHEPIVILLHAVAGIRRDEIGPAALNRVLGFLEAFPL